jgi:hypothetical protein
MKPEKIEKEYYKILDNIKKASLFSCQADELLESGIYSVFDRDICYSNLADEFLKMSKFVCNLEKLELEKTKIFDIQNFNCDYNIKPEIMDHNYYYDLAIKYYRLSLYVYYQEEDYFMNEMANSCEKYFIVLDKVKEDIGKNMSVDYVLYANTRQYYTFEGDILQPENLDLFMETAKKLRILENNKNYDELYNKIKKIKKSLKC